MAHAIGPKCNSCQACVGICPTDSIFAGKGRFAIDTDTCDDCKLCWLVCPEEAIAFIPGSDQAETEPVTASDTGSGSDTEKKGGTPKKGSSP